MTKRAYFTIAIFIFLLIAGVYYVKLGGFNEMQTQIVERPKLYLAGKNYFGITTSSRLHDVIREIDHQLKDSLIQGELMVCYFGNPDQDDDSVQVFVGAATNELQQDIPEGLERMELPAKRAVQATFNAYSFVSPNPDKVNARLKALAQEKQLMLDTVYIERYLSPQEIYNEIYIIE